ncbi:hypothetical protein BDF21DRAFT_399777 [Thamnidium elegans]|nr:hypothetical protein BDF21DRAFT_399777 [Thamnidium elegans]
MLRMLSKLPQEGPSFKDIPIEPTTKPHDPLQYVPAKRNYESEFYAKFDTIPLLDHNRRAAKDLGPNKFWERKRRHADMIDNESFVAHSDTNYSRLDYKPTPLGRNHQDNYDDDDDNRTWRTQDMLSEDDDNVVVLDPQKIVELRRTIDEQFIKESLLRSSQRQMESQSQKNSQIPELEPQLPEKKQLPVELQLPEITTQEPVNNDIKSPLITDTQPTDDMPDLSPQPSVHSTMDLREIREEINNLPGADDWGDDYGLDLSDNERDQVEAESDTNIEPEIKANLFELIPSTRPRELFANKLGFNTKLIGSKARLQEISNLFFDQLIKDIKAEKSRTPINMDRVTDQDIIQVMKRQQILDDRTTVEQLAHKNLPRELTELLCTSALEQNVLYPRKRRVIIKRE